MNKKVLRSIGMSLLLPLLLSGCGEMTEQKEITLVLGTFGENPVLLQQVEVFEEAHPGYKIEIRTYNRFEQEEGDGIARLQREIVSGQGPDIINFGYGYSVTDILGKYTEDLFPYFEKSAEEDAYFGNVLQAFSYQEGLYAMPVSFSLKTFVGRKSLVGERESWSIDELIGCYETEREKSGGSLLLYPGEIKKDVFGTIITGNVESFVDWEQKTCRFDEEEFIKVMEFAGGFPDTLMITEDFSPMECFGNGGALLYPMILSSVYDICKAELILKEEPVYIGYPVNGDDGTVIQASELMLAISGVSEHKEVAWDFLCQFLSEEYQKEITAGFPVNRAALEYQLEQGKSMEYSVDEEGKMKPVAQDEILFEGEEPLEIYQITEAEGDALRALIERASIASAYDDRLHRILLEEVDSYFCGDKTAQQAAEVMQGRAEMYIGEF